MQVEMHKFFFFKPLLVSYLLIYHWPKQVAWQSPESRSGHFAQDGRGEELGPILQSIYHN